MSKLSLKHKNSKLKYYVLNYGRQLVPSNFYQKRLSKKLSYFNQLSEEDQKEVLGRVNYYIQLEEPFQLSTKSKKLHDLSVRQGHKTYYFDMYENGRYFDQELRGHFLFGDITKIPSEPSFVKSRPISATNHKAVLLKWNKVRHFVFIKDDLAAFAQKKNMLVGRGSVYPSQPQRMRFLEMYIDHPMCNIGQSNTDEPNPRWMKPSMTIDQQLEYKFILSIEGNDVATNLKWIMSSNSLAVMPKPKYETWFMEGHLVSDVHYVAIKDDYSDLEERLQYYIDNPQAAALIIENARQHVAQFQNKKIEDLISLMVMDRYFRLIE